MNLALIPIILVVWCLVGSGLIALGRFCFPDSTLAVAGLAGFCLAFLPLLVINFIGAIFPIYLVLLCVLGLVWLIPHRREVFRVENLPLVLVMLVLAILAARNAIEYDDGLYHIQT